MKWIGLFVAGAALVCCGEYKIYVDAAGSTEGVGSQEAPFAALEQARASIRAGRADGSIASNEQVTVNIAPGRYFVCESFKLGSEDGGTAGAPVTYRALKKGSARFCGGAVLNPADFVPAADKTVLERLDPLARSRVVVCDVSAHAPPGGFPEFAPAYRGVPAAPLLYVNGRPMTIARWPNLESDAGNWADFTKAIDTGKADPESADPVLRKERPGAFVFDDARAERWDIAKGVWLLGYWTHDWFDEVIRIAAYDRASKIVRLAAPHSYGIMGGTWGRKARRFYALNLLEELDAPGEWYLDRGSGMLYLYPEEGFDTAEIVLATLRQPMVEAKGAAHLAFEGLVLECGHSLGLLLTEVNNVHIAGCEIFNFAAGGISLNGVHSSVRSCDVFNIGRAGISVNGGDRKTLSRADNLIENNHVHHFGIYQRTYAAGISVQGCGTAVRHNLIHDAPHAAVLYGGNEHLFAYNEIHRVVMETGDAGAFYTGRDWTTQGNLLHHNYVHHLGGGDSDHVNTMGFYFDDCDCGDAVVGNVFYKAGRAVMIGGGREHPVENNLIVECPIGLHIDSRGMSWKQWNEPGTSWDLIGKAEKLNYTQPPWSEKYPRLARIMEDSPREPLYNPIRNNLFVDCAKEICHFDKGVMDLLDKFEIENNVAVFTSSTNRVPLKEGIPGFTLMNGKPDEPIDLGFRDQSEGDFSLRWWRPAVKRLAPHFKEIPFDKIGLYKDGYRRRLPER